MNLLIITQVIDRNDSALGFFIRWIEEFAKKYDKVSVICLYKGEYNLPRNVSVYSLGKELSKSKIKYLVKFIYLIWRHRMDYGSVFVHMNQIYVILGSFFWRAWKKKICLWYAHGSVSLSLKCAVRLADFVVTSTPEGCRVKNDKIRIVGQGIDTEKFNIKEEHGVDLDRRAITIGRISVSKDILTIIKAIDTLKAENIKITLKIIGEPLTINDIEYFEQLKIIAQNNEDIEFVGKMPNVQLPEYLQNSGLFISASLTGSLDKAILEAMACGVIPITCNEAAAGVLADFGEKLIFRKGDVDDLVKKINGILSLNQAESRAIRLGLRKIVTDNYYIGSLINKIITNYNY